jgi:hypothetical protein
MLRVVLDLIDPTGFEHDIRTQTTRHSIPQFKEKEAIYIDLLIDNF